MKEISNFAIWLCPQKSEESELASIIKLLVSCKGGALFAPHMTLYAGRDGSEQELIGLLSELSCAIPKMQIPVVQIGTRPEFLKAIYFELQLTEQLGFAVSQSLRRFEQFGAYEIFPHLSLLYSDTREADKGELIDKISYHPKVITFDQISLIAPPNGPNGWRDVATWREISSMKLTG